MTTLTMKLLPLISGIIVFWNVENFFDSTPQTDNSSERSFSSTGDRRWTKTRFRTKAQGICKVILALSDSTGTPPPLVALAEVENDRCLNELVYGTALRKFGYRYIHFDSRDPRGIDCALLHRGMKPIRYRAIPLVDERGDTILTRDMLAVEFDSIAVVVCHLPSKRGGSKVAARRRELALNTLSGICDSIAGKGLPVIAIGDFNDTRTALSDSLMRPMREIPADGDSGSLKYEGRWEQIDRAFASEDMQATLRVITLKYLLTEDKKYGGEKPLRTYIGPRYAGGLSDHLPIEVRFSTPPCGHRRK